MRLLSSYKRHRQRTLKKDRRIGYDHQFSSEWGSLFKIEIEEQRGFSCLCPNSLSSWRGSFITDEKTQHGSCRSRSINKWEKPFGVEDLGDRMRDWNFEFKTRWGQPYEECFE